MDFFTFDSFLDSVFVINENREIVYCNEAAALLCESSVRRMSKNKHIYDFIVLEDKELFTSESGTAGFEEQTPYIETGFKLSHQDKEGKVQVCINPINNGNGQFWLVLMRDVTLEETLQHKYRSELDGKEKVIDELKIAKEAVEQYSKNLEQMVLERTQEITKVNSFLQAVMNSLGQGLLVFDSEGTIGDISTKACRDIFETKPNGKKIEEILKVPETSLIKFNTWRKSLFMEPKRFDDIKKLGPKTFKHSKNKRVELDYYALKNGEGEVTNVVVVGTDKTAEYEAFIAMEKARDMSEKAKRLSEQLERERMESELATARAVQETLFPPRINDFDKITIGGHYEPASECGGDWWNCSKVGDRVLLWIGDATGHGVPAALITSAAKSAGTIIEDMPEISVGRALEILNKAVYETAKGNINMTFFIASIDLNKNLITYANASHEFPYLIQKKEDGPISKKDFVPLLDVTGLRLGDKKDTKYEEGQIEINSGDYILFYTDGIIDLQNPQGEGWGERRFNKAISQSLGIGQPLEQKLDALVDEINSFRDGADLIDDVTLCIAQYK